MTLRARLLAGTVIVVLVLVGAALVVTRTTERFLVDRVDEQLLAAVPFAERAPPDTRPTAPPPSEAEADDDIGPSTFFVGVIDADGDLTAAALPNLADEQGSVPDVDAAEARAAARADEPQPFTVGSDGSDTRDTFGWPIGLVLDRDEYRPRPTGEGIRAIVAADRWDEEEKSYDYWELRTDGDFYQLSSLFEDQRGSPDRLFFNTRIVRVTEAVLYCARLYERLGVESTATVRMRVAHGGLEGRVLTSAMPDRRLSMPRSSGTDEVAADVSFALGSVAEDLVSIVRTLVSRLFEVFDFFELGDEVYDQIVNRFVAGQVS